MSGYYAKVLGGKDVISSLIALGALWNGTAGPAGENYLQEIQEQLGLSGALSIPLCPACLQAVAGSDFITALNADGSPYVSGVRYTNIATKYDELVIPYTAGLTPGPAGTAVNNIVVQDGCAIDRTAHRGLAATRRVAAFVLNALDDASHRPAPCAVVEPNSGVG